MATWLRVDFGLAHENLWCVHVFILWHSWNGVCVRGRERERQRERGEGKLSSSIFLITFSLSPIWPWCFDRHFVHHFPSFQQKNHKTLLLSALRYYSWINYHKSYFPFRLNGSLYDDNHQWFFFRSLCECKCYNNNINVSGLSVGCWCWSPGSEGLSDTRLLHSSQLPAVVRTACLPPSPSSSLSVTPCTFYSHFSHTIGWTHLMIGYGIHIYKYIFLVASSCSSSRLPSHACEKAEYISSSLSPPSPTLGLSYKVRVSPFPRTKWGTSRKVSCLRNYKGVFTSRLHYFIFLDPSRLLPSKKMKKM